MFAFVEFILFNGELNQYLNDRKTLNMEVIVFLNIYLDLRQNNVFSTFALRDAPLDFQEAGLGSLVRGEFVFIPDWEEIFFFSRFWR